jgi:hypothetical protein
MNLSQIIRERIVSGALPTWKPPTVGRARGAGGLCSVCDSAIPQTDRQVRFVSGKRGMLDFHVGCHALWIAVLIDGGWLAPRTARD